MGIQKPSWLKALYAEKFFVPCSIHESAKKNEKNVCCLDCNTSICPHCVTSHRVHRLLQIRRYVYHEVVRLEDIENLIDCSNIQISQILKGRPSKISDFLIAYTINNAKVFFIKKRPQNRQFKGGNYCTSCDRSLQEPFIHCSLGCKVDFVLKHHKDLSPFLRRCTILQLSSDFFIPQDMGDDDMAIDTAHSTIVDNDEPWSSSSSTGSGSENMSFPCTEFVRKKRSGMHVCGRSANNCNNITEEDMATSISRRKGIPQRSPLC